MHKYGKIQYLLFIIISILLVSCQKNEKAEQLKVARSIMNDKPKEALSLLDSIVNPQSMDEGDYMLYILTKTDLKIKNKQDVTNDTLIYQAQSYYNEQNDLQKATIANYIAGEVAYDRKTDGKALESYLKAEYYARKMNEELMIAKSLHCIANLYFIQESMDSAIVLYKKANSYYSRIKGSENNQLLTIHQIGRAYDDLNNVDSSLVYFNKGLSLAEELNNEKYQRTFIHMLGIAWREKADYNKSEEYLSKALAEATDKEEEVFRIHLSLAKLFIRLNKADIAQSHIEEAKKGISQINNSIDLRNIYTSLINYYKLSADHQQYAYYTDLKHAVIQKISEEKGLEKLMDVKKEYQLSLRQKELANIEFRYNVLLIGGIILTALLLSVILLLIFNSRLKREKEKKNKEILEQKIDKLVFLSEIYQHIINDWVSIDKEVKKLAKEYGAEEKPELYKKIEKLISDIREKSNLRLLESAKAFILKLEHGEKALSLLNDREILIFFLRYHGYNKYEITAILGANVRAKFHPILLDIQRKFKEAGMSEEVANQLLFTNEVVIKLLSTNAPKNE